MRVLRVARSHHYTAHTVPYNGGKEILTVFETFIQMPVLVIS
jgi:hypothetical protein